MVARLLLVMGNSGSAGLTLCLVGQCVVTGIQTVLVATYCGMTAISYLWSFDREELSAPGLAHALHTERLE